MTNTQWELIQRVLRRPDPKPFFGPKVWKLTKKEMDAIRALVELYRQEREA